MKRVLFNAYDPVLGVELWVTDGTAAGTYKLKEINPGGGFSNPAQFTSFRGKALFVADDGVHGPELWITDGTSDGTALLKDIRPGSGDPALGKFTVLGDKMLFRANDGVNGTELWVTDGTAAGTVILKDIAAGSLASAPEWLTVFGDKVLFQANDAVNGLELWVTDGTSDGTMLLKDINPGAVGSGPGWFKVFGDKVLFQAYDSVHSTELWVTDGTAAGTVLLRDISTNGSSPTSFTVLGDKVLFSASDTLAGTELWVTDGTKAGTAMLKDLIPGSGGSSPFSLFRFGEKILFNAGVANSADQELWITDGTAAGTVLLKELNPGPTGSWAAGFKILGDKVIFQATTTASGIEGWVTDGTPEGTMLLKDIAPGSSNSYAGGGTILGDVILFQANDLVTGPELWMTDGTTAGTVMLKDIVPGGTGSYVSSLTTISFAEAFLEGTAGDDTLVGGTGGDALFGKDGNDRLEGGDGADELEGGAGDDVVEGQGADDILDGGNGSDVLGGGDGNDRLNGGAGIDQLDGGAGDDRLDPGRIEGEEEAHGGQGIDTLYAAFAATGTAGLSSSVTVNPLGGYDGWIGNGAGLGVTFSGIERFILSGTAGADDLAGGSLDDILSGGAGNDVLTGGDGGDSLDGGTGGDLMTGGAGNDSYRVDDSGDIVVEAEAGGTDEVATTLAAYTLGANVERLRGTSAGQSLTGNALDNRIEAGSGNDVIDGGAGADRMIGGTGNDVFVVDDSGDAVEDSAGTDEIRTGLASYSLDGTGSVENLTGTLATGQQLTGNTLANRIVGGDGRDDLRGEAGSDQLVGGGEDDLLSGGSGTDTLSGGAGNDLLDGGAEADAMTGGSGDDVYHLDDQLDTVVEAADGGTDEIRIYGTGYYTLAANVENATVVAGSWHILVGNALVNVLTGTAGGERLDGGAGADTLIGGKGSDTYMIDNVGDVIVEEEDDFPFTHVGAGDSVVTSLADYVLRADLENLEGTSAQQRLVGTERGNFIRSGGGFDTLVGGKGDDSYSVYAGDTIVELADEGVDTVYVNGGNFTLGDNVERLSGQSSSGQVLTGNGFANEISASSGNDTLDGGGGADSLRGGHGNDVYYVDEVGDVVTESAGEGTDEVRTSLASYSLLGTNLEKLTATSDGAHDFRGSSGNNTITGGAGHDILRLQDGGFDTVLAGGGNDNIFFIGSLTAGDVVNGGSGTDTLILQGPYGSLALSANVTQIENISILGGNNTNFGEPGTNRYDYVLTVNNANFAAGVQARINGSALLAGEDFTFNGSAETDALFVVYGGKGKDTLTGGLGNDIFFYAEERFASGDTVNGGVGYDGMFLRGNYTIDFTAAGYTGLFTSIENLTLTSATDERYARGGGTEFDYNLTLSDAIVGAGQLLTVSGALLMASETMVFDASAESDGVLRLFGGKASDTLKGGALDDLIHGSLGGDTLAGNGGADAFRYQDIAESNLASMDQILDFTAGTDKIELDRIDANSLVAGNQAFAWIGSDAFTGSAGQLRAYEQGGTWFVEGDVNGDGSADLVIALTLQGPTPLGTGDFVL